MSSRRSRRSILLVARGAPPSPLPGARRIAGLSRYLEELGYEVTVLTSMVFGSGSEHWGPSRVVRTRELLASPLLTQRGRSRGPAAGASEGQVDKPTQGSTDSAHEMRLSRLARIAVPDLAAATWIPFALPRALSLEAQHGFDCVITSGPPPSTHLVGLALHAKGVPWLADVRDGWTFEQPDRPPHVPIAAWLDRKLERLVFSRANVVTAVTPRLTEDLVRRFGVDAVTVTNGFDPAERVAAGTTHSDVFTPGRHSLLYTGTMYRSRFAPFGTALSAVLRDRPELASQLEVVIVGPRWEGVAELAGRDDLAPVRWRPPLPRSEILALQRQADSLLVLLEPDRPGLVTTKLYEYMAADRPIMVAGPKGDAAQILEDAGGGFSVEATPEGLASGLERLLSGEPPPAGRSGRDAYTYPRIAAQMADQIERAIAGRASSPRWQSHRF